MDRAFNKRALMGLFDGIKQMKKNNDDFIKSFTKPFEDKKAAVEAHKQAVMSGDISPITPFVKLKQGEKAYAELPAKRKALVTTTIQRTAQKTKKKGGITRAVVGGALLGPVGAVVGASTAKSKGNSVGYAEEVENMSDIDKGVLVFTDQRMLFVGQEIVSIPYDELVDIRFIDMLTGAEISVKYAGMLEGEKYFASGKEAKLSKMYYQAITEKLVKG